MKGRQQRGTYDSAAELRKIGTSIGDIAGMASTAATDIDALRARVEALEADKARLVAALDNERKRLGTELQDICADIQEGADPADHEGRIRELNEALALLAEHDERQKEVDAARAELDGGSRDDRD